MDRRTLLAIVIVGIIIVLTPYYYNLVSPPQEMTPSDTVNTAMVQNEGDRGSTPAVSGESSEPLEQSSSATMDAENMDRPWYAADPAGEAEMVEVSTPLYTARFSTRGATVHSWTILPTQPYLSEGEQLVRPSFADRNLVLTARGGMGLLRTEEKNFKVDRKRISLNKSSQPISVTFTLPLPEGGYYREIYTFYPDRYDVDLKLESKNLTRLTGAPNVWFGWGGGLAMTEQDTAQELYYSQSMYLMGKTQETLKGNGKKVEEDEATGGTDWVAQRTKYFLMALVPEQQADGARLRTFVDNSYKGKHPPKLYETSLSLGLAETGDLNHLIKLYLGPLDYGTIRAADPSLEETMSWGWKIIEPFSKGIYWILVWLHTFIPNYGVVLIIFSIAIKVVVWPLTHKSQQSMKRMQMLQPVMKDLQAKHKDNPQKMQQEVMGLYKKYKVNPMGGCWPVLLQMPLLYALFIVFRSTIELRGQPFIFWINDLSMPDALITFPFHIPLYGDHLAVLPIVMAISTYLQSKTTMTDPNQKAMLYMMPIMFIFLFNNFPSGLTLYYTLFNLLSWAQTKLIKIQDPSLAKAVEENQLEHEKQAMREERRARKKNRSSDS
ncbi:membrane protein insertase YidC [bacterium]|nr:membrane protein insertase YidC [bacterium]